MIMLNKQTENIIAYEQLYGASEGLKGILETRFALLGLGIDTLLRHTRNTSL